jgi:hypothetical protein
LRHKICQQENHVVQFDLKSLQKLKTRIPVGCRTHFVLQTPLHIEINKPHIFPGLHVQLHEIPFCVRHHKSSLHHSSLYFHRFGLLPDGRRKTIFKQRTRDLRLDYADSFLEHVCNRFRLHSRLHCHFQVKANLITDWVKRSRLSGFQIQDNKRCGQNHSQRVQEKNSSRQVHRLNLHPSKPFGSLSILLSI